jgi:murein DD-endopeptidase MepM/ murein hydrolase activator NlpD
LANESYTLIIVPHAKARFRKVQVPVRLVKWVSASLGLGSLILGGILIHYTRINYEVHELRQLRAQNTVLSSKALAYEQNATRLQAKVLALQNMVTKLGVMAGLEKTLPDAQVGGVGGVSSLEIIAPSVDLKSMDQTVTDLTRKSSRLEEFFQDQKLLLSSTPSVWPVRGYLSASFGNRLDPFTGLRDFHSGIDVSTPIGTKVQAPADGVVIFCGVKGGYGNAMVIDHGYGLVTRYGHLAGFNTKPGQRVRRGDVIAFVGSTGKSTAPHLHYEVWLNDQAQNPIQYILDEFKSFG